MTPEEFAAIKSHQAKFKAWATHYKEDPEFGRTQDIDALIAEVERLQNPDPTDHCCCCCGEGCKRGL